MVCSVRLGSVRFSCKSVRFIRFGSVHSVHSVRFSPQQPPPITHQPLHPPTNPKRSKKRENSAPPSPKVFYECDSKPKLPLQHQSGDQDVTRHCWRDTTRKRPGQHPRLCIRPLGSSSQLLSKETTCLHMHKSLISSSPHPTPTPPPAPLYLTDFF